MKLCTKISLLCLTALLAACGGKNLYKKAPSDLRSENTPLVRSKTFPVRVSSFDTGAEPVEIGAVLTTPSTLYVSSPDRGLEAFHSTNFSPKWRASIEAGVSAQPVLQNDILYFGANDGSFYAVGAEFGNLIWKYDAKAPVFSKALIWNDRIYFTSSDDTVHCIEKSTGAWVWYYKRGQPNYTTVRGNSTPAVANGLIYVGFSDGHIVGVGANDGNIKWEKRIHTGVKFRDVDASPLIENDKLYIASYDGEAYAFDLKKGGSIIWKSDIGSAKKILLDGKNLLIAGSDGGIHALNKESGKKLWKFKLDRGVPTELLLEKDLLIFGSSQQYFYGIDRNTGEIAYRFDAGLRSGFSSSPMIQNKEVFIFSNFGNLYSFRFRR